MVVSREAAVWQVGWGVLGRGRGSKVGLATWGLGSHEPVSSPHPTAPEAEGFHFRKAPSLFSPIYSRSVFRLRISQRSSVPPSGGKARKLIILSFVLGPKHLRTPKKSQILSMF